MANPHAHPDGVFLLSHPAHFIALGLGSGLAPKAPGTFGTLAALPLYALLAGFLSPLQIAVLCVPVFLLGAWAAQRTCHDLGVHDHGGIVIDEIVAMWLVLVAAPASLAGWGAAFDHSKKIMTSPLNWAELLAPAQEHATHVFAVSHSLANGLALVSSGKPNYSLHQSEDFRSLYFTPEGHPPGFGAVMRQPRLAETLARRLGASLPVEAE